MNETKTFSLWMWRISSFFFWLVCNMHGLWFSTTKIAYKIENQFMKRLGLFYFSSSSSSSSSSSLFSFFALFHRTTHKKGREKITNPKVKFHFCRSLLLVDCFYCGERKCRWATKGQRGRKKNCILFDANINKIGVIPCKLDTTRQPTESISTRKIVNWTINIYGISGRAKETWTENGWLSATCSMHGIHFVQFAPTFRHLYFNCIMFFRDN